MKPALMNPASMEPEVCWRIPRLIWLNEERHDGLDGQPYIAHVLPLTSGAPTMKRRVGMMPPESGMRVGALISDLESVAKDFEALASFFKTAAARLTLV
jgi:hypothetical protein